MRPIHRIALALALAGPLSVPAFAVEPEAPNALVTRAEAVRIAVHAADEPLPAEPALTGMEPAFAGSHASSEHGLDHRDAFRPLAVVIGGASEQVQADRLGPFGVRV